MYANICSWRNNLVQKTHIQSLKNLYVNILFIKPLFVKHFFFFRLVKTVTTFLTSNLILTAFVFKLYIHRKNDYKIFQNSKYLHTFYAKIMCKLTGLGIWDYFFAWMWPFTSVTSQKLKIRIRIKGVSHRPFYPPLLRTS